MKKFAGKPITFDAESILAILASHKTQTRRVVRPQPELENNVWRWKPRRGWDVNIAHINRAMCPYWSDEKLLWVRENFRLADFWESDALIPRREENYTIPGGVWVEGQNELGLQVPTVQYVADNAFNHEPPPYWKPGILHPSIFLPHWAHRIELELLDARIEWLQQISHSDAEAEGLCCYHENYQCALDDFPQRWDHLNAKRGFSWNSNPFVFVLTFKLANVVSYYTNT